MDKKIFFQFGSFKVEALLNDSMTTQMIMEGLPIESVVNLWGDEIYFETPVMAALEGEGITEVTLGDVAYWPPGRALCIFFGPTPLSEGDRIIPAGPVNLIGRIIGETGPLKQVEDREIVKMNKVLDKEDQP